MRFTASSVVDDFSAQPQSIYARGCLKKAPALRELTECNDACRFFAWRAQKRLNRPGIAAYALNLVKELAKFVRMTDTPSRVIASKKLTQQN